MNYVALFFAGAFLCNCIPHLAAGLCGRPFPSPFAKPPGRGNSAPMVNFLWGTFNLVAGLLLLAKFPMIVGWEPTFAAFLAGFIVLGLFCSRHFGQVRRRNWRR